MERCARHVEGHLDALGADHLRAVEELVDAVAEVPPHGRILGAGRGLALHGDHRRPRLEDVACDLEHAEELEVGDVAGAADLVQGEDRERGEQRRDLTEVREHHGHVGQAVGAPQGTEPGAVARLTHLTRVADVARDAHVAGPRAVRLANLGERHGQPSGAAVGRVGILSRQRIGVSEGRQGSAPALRGQLVEVVGPRVEAPRPPDLVVGRRREREEARATMVAREDGAGADVAVAGDEAEATLDARSQLAARARVIVGLAVLPVPVHVDGPPLVDPGHNHPAGIGRHDRVVRLSPAEIEPVVPTARAAEKR